MKSQANIDRGRVAKAAGDAWEAFIEAQHTLAWNLGILFHVVHNEAHSKVLGGRIMYVSAGVADYSLVLRHGIAGAIEAKSTTKSYLPRSAIEPKQAKHLDAVAAAGGLALLLVEFRHEDAPSHRFAVPWMSTPWSVKRTAESVSEEDLAEWRITHGCYLARFHEGGTAVGDPLLKRTYPRE